MIKPKKNTLVYRFFCWYIQRIIKKNFHSLNYNSVEIAADKSVLLLANHYSWWDGFVFLHLNKIYFNKRFHVMVMEETAKEIWFMKYIGAFGVKKNSREMFKSLTYAGELLNDSENLLLIFPQGKLHSSHLTKIVFQKGLVKIIEASKKEFQFLFAASFTDYFENKKPSLQLYLKTESSKALITLPNIESAYNAHFSEALEMQKGRMV
jgi:1-acyl-sn-glycerol-3-phosphate acyltransferase